MPRRGRQHQRRHAAPPGSDHRAGHHGGVDDIDAALARIEQLGGKVAVGKQPISGMGFSAYLHDTEGNLIGLWPNG